MRVHWEDSKEGNLCAVLRSPFIVESSKLEVLQRGAVTMRGVSEIREELGHSGEKDKTTLFTHT